MISKLHQHLLLLFVGLLVSCAGPHVPQPPCNVRLLAISDVDDTIKDTHVTKSPLTHEKNPWLFFDFLRSWKPVSGMSKVYSAWNKNDGAAFAYVSGGPPIYQQRLQRFLARYGFPAGAIYLNRSFPGPSFRHKLQTISQLLDASPHARVILIGDSGEKDPLVYAEIQRRYPSRVAKICIRAVTDDAKAIVNDQKIRTHEGERWQVFAEASELTPMSRL